MDTNPYTVLSLSPEPPGLVSQGASLAEFPKTYTITSSMLHAANKQYFLAESLGRKWVWLLTVLGCSVFCFLFNYTTIAAVASLIAVFWTMMWIKSYVRLQDQVKTEAELWNNTQVTVDANETGIGISSPCFTYRFEWAQINRIKETADYIVLLKDKLPLVSLPKSEFSSSAIAAIQSYITTSGRDSFQ